MDVGGCRGKDRSCTPCPVKTRERGVCSWTREAKVFGLPRLLWIYKPSQWSGRAFPGHAARPRRGHQEAFASREWLPAFCWTPRGPSILPSQSHLPEPPPAFLLYFVVQSCGKNFTPTNQFLNTRFSGTSATLSRMPSPTKYR